jgi:hypothetical protein
VNDVTRLFRNQEHGINCFVNEAARLPDRQLLNNFLRFRPRLGVWRNWLARRSNRKFSSDPKVVSSSLAMPFDFDGIYCRSVIFCLVFCIQKRLCCCCKALRHGATKPASRNIAALWVIRLRRCLALHWQGFGNSSLSFLAILQATPAYIKTG